MSPRTGIWETEVKGRVAYAEAFPDEMEAAERANDVSLEELKRKLPNLEVFTVDADCR